MGVEYRDIEKCPSVSVTPEALCPDVHTGSMISVGGGMGKRLCGQCLEWWLDADIMACLGHGVGSEVPNPIMFDGGKATHAVAKCMFH